MEFNDRLIGFLVDSVDRIFRMSWSDVKPMPMGQDNTAAAITKPQMRRLVELLDGLLTRTGSADDRTDADMLPAVD